MILLGLLAIVIGLLLAAGSGRGRALGAAAATALGAGGPDDGDGDGTDDGDAEDAEDEEDEEVAEDEEDVPALRLGDAYTRAEIHAMLGGGVLEYLPHVGGRVVCGCFNPGYHPYAPFVVLPGLRPTIQRWALALAGQGNAVPCFLKREADAWEYVGDFRVAEVSRDPDEIDEWARIAEREGDVSMVLHLEEVRADDGG